MVISSRQNDKIKRVASLKEKKYRSLYGEYVVEGIKMVTEAILSGQPIKEIYGLTEVLLKLPECGVRCVEVTESVFSSMTDTKAPQGVLAVVAMPSNALLPPSGNCVVLDGVADPGNVGTVIRTAAALGIKDIYIIDGADAFSPKTIRSSMSGIFFTNIHVCDRQTAAELLVGCSLVVADMSGESVFKARVKEPYAIVVGNEANGISQFFLERANSLVSLPMERCVESLNAAVAFSVIAYTLKGREEI